MQSISRRVFMASAVLMAMTFPSNIASAQTELKVPFSFTAVGKTFPAGSYVVTRNDAGTIVTLTNRESSRAVSWVLGPGPYVNSASRVAMTFDSATHALHSIDVGRLSTPRLDRRRDDSREGHSWLSHGR